ncbi:MAG TPA: PDR/VanB family oxidoreductase [Usitatibacter sp.]
MTSLPAPLTLRVARAEKVAADIHSFELRSPSGGELPPFTAGAHVTVKSRNGSLRKYSLCNDPAERDRYVIAVKRDPAGRGGSVDLVDHTRVGDGLEVCAPRNAFELAASAPSFILIAGGIGIAPILSMARSLNAEGRRYTLYYLARSPAHAAFRDELQRGEFAGKVVIHHDGGDPARSFDLWPILEKPSAAHVYCCGPRPLLGEVRDMTGHWPAAAIHFESFIDAGAAAKPGDRPFAVVLAKSGDRLEVPVGLSILEVMRSRGHDAPSSCESGTCGTCRTRLISGEADHRDLVLMEDEKATQIMICVSRARSPEIVIDR